MWHIVQDSRKEYNFILQKEKTSTSFKVLAIGDIQIGSSEELLYAANSILKEVNNRDDYDLTIYLGDLVNDTPELFSSLKTMIENTEKMYRVVYGNHDRNFSSSQESQQTFSGTILVRKIMLSIKMVYYLLL